MIWDQSDVNDQKKDEKIWQDSDDEQPQIQSAPILLQKNNNQNNLIPSGFKPLYLQGMGIDEAQNFQFFSENISDKFINRLRKLNIVFNRFDFKQVNIEVQQCTQNSTCMEMKVRLGYFTLTIYVLNKPNSIIQNGPNANVQGTSQISGCFGKIIYRSWDRGIVQQHQFNCNQQRTTQNFVQKIIYFSKSQSQSVKNQAEVCSKIFHESILEYCFCKIAFAFQIGPQVEPMFGFDLVCYKNGVLFMMEPCRSLRNDEFTDNIEQVSAQLKKALKVLHSIRIIHNDIKFDNIMYSQCLRKVVFIDFGLSELVNQQVGQKTYSLFKGSYYFVSEEMKSLIVKNQGFIDLYWNDLHCLQKSMEFLRLKQKSLGMVDFEEDQIVNEAEFDDCQTFSTNSVSNQNLNKTHSKNTNFSSETFVSTQQDQQLTEFSLPDTQLISYQLLYLLFRKRIQHFKSCLSVKNHITENQRILLMNLVMDFVREQQGVPMYDQIYHENYSIHSYRIQYENQKQTESDEEIIDKTSSKLSDLSKLKKNDKRDNPTKKAPGFRIHLMANSWVTVFDEISRKIYQLTSIKQNLNKSRHDLGQNVDLSELLQCFSQQYPAVQQNLCNILVYALTIPINQHTQIRKISKKMIRMFKNAIFKLINEGAVEQKLNLPKINSSNEFLLKKELIKFIEEVCEVRDQNFQNRGKIGNELEVIGFTLVNRMIEKYIYKKQVIQMIEKKQINLFIDPQKIHSSMKKVTTQQKIQLILFTNYCDQQDYINSYRIMEQMNQKFNPAYKLEAEVISLAIFLKIFNSQISQRSNYDFLNRLKDLSQILKGKRNYSKKQLQISQKVIKKCNNMYDFESNQDYLDFFIEYLELEININKGLADYNFRTLLQRVNEMKLKLDTYLPIDGNKTARIQIESQIIILKIMIMDEMHNFQECYQLGITFYNYFVKGSKDRQIGIRMLCRAYSFLGVEEKKIDSGKQNTSKLIQQEEIIKIQEFQQYSSSFEKILIKEKLQINFLNRYRDFKSIDQNQCIKDFKEIMEVIHSTKSNNKMFSSQWTLKISMILSLFGMVFRLGIKSIQDQIFVELKILVEKQIQINFFTSFYSETLFILHQIIEEIISVVLEDRKAIPNDFWAYFHGKYQQFVYLIFQDKKQLYPASFWISKIILKDRSSKQSLINLVEQYQLWLKILLTLEQFSSMQISYRHLNFTIYFIQKLTHSFQFSQSEILQQIESNFDFLIDILKKSVKTIIDTKRRYLFFFYISYTQSCLELLYKKKDYHSIFWVFQEMASYMCSFPGQQNMESFYQVCNIVENLDVSQEFISIMSQNVQRKIKQKQFNLQFRQLVPLFIILCRRVVELNFNSVLISDWFLKKLTLQFHQLHRYMKEKLFPKYLKLFIRIYQWKKKPKKQALMHLKAMRTIRRKDSIELKQKKFKSWIQFFKQKTGNRSLSMISVKSQLYRQSMIAKKLISKLKKLFTMTMEMNQDQIETNRLRGFKISRMVSSAQIVR